MLKGTTSTGFEFEISDATLNDWRLLEHIADMEEGDDFAVVRLARVLLSDNDQYKRLMEHCTVEGRVERNKVTDEIIEIMKSGNEVKN